MLDSDSIWSLKYSSQILINQRAEGQMKMIHTLVDGRCIAYLEVHEQRPPPEGGEIVARQTLMERLGGHKCLKDVEDSCRYEVGKHNIDQIVGTRHQYHDH